MPQAFLAIFLLALGWSYTGPSDDLTWALEVGPLLVGLPLLLWAQPKIQFSNLTLGVLTFSALLMCIGAYYTYAMVPAGFWVQEAFDLSRNHYDRLGHFFQGVAPALVLRELLLKTSPLKPGKWLFFIVTMCVLAFSACYELLEWLAALIFGDGSTSFLGIQGDIWDAQADMGLALLGAILAQVLFGKTQDRGIQPHKR
jgi:putative membrane protein